MQAHSLRRRGLFTVTDLPTRLLALEVRGALSLRRTSRPRDDLSRSASGVGRGVGSRKIWQIEIQADAQSFLRQPLREWRLRCNFFGERQSCFSELRVRDDFVDHPDSLGFGGVDNVAAQNEFVRACESDQPRQYEQSARLGNQSAPDEDFAEARLVGADAHIAHQRDVAAVADGGAVDRRDGRLRISDEQVKRDGAMLAPFLDQGALGGLASRNSGLRKISLTSSPAQNARPAPVSTTTRTLSSASASRNASL